MFLYRDDTRKMLEDWNIKSILKDFDRNKKIYFSILEEAEKNGFNGLTLKHNGFDQWSVITPDQDQLCRYTCFDNRGFFAHGSYDQYLEAFNEIFEMGYRTLCPPATLDLIANNWPKK